MKKLSLILLFPCTVISATLTNQITGVGPNGQVKPWICLQNKAGEVALKLAPGASGDANKASGNSYYAGATLRFNGCDNSDPYLGYVGISINDQGNNSIANYLPPANIHINYDEKTINKQGLMTGKIVYTPISANNDLTPANPANNWDFAGINLSGLEFGKVIDPVVIPNLAKEDSESSYSDLNDTNSFIQAGMNTVRLPLSWGYLQLDGPGKGGLNMQYFTNYVQPLLETLTKAKVNTIVDLHAYMRYSQFGEEYSGCGPGGKCPDGTLITDEKAYQSIWGQLAKAILADENIDKDYLLFDLMNEPVGVPDAKVFSIQVAVIKTLREQGFTGYLLVEGNNWSGLHSWDQSWVGSDNQSYSNASLFTRDHFVQAGITDLSKILINVHQYLDSDFSGTHDDCQADLSTQGTSGFNLNNFVDYLQQNQLKAIVTEFGVGKNSNSCSAPLQSFMQYLQDNSSKGKDYGFAGWTIWSTGHGWGDYNLRVKPDSYAMSILQQFL